MKTDFTPLLLGKDIRSISRSNDVARVVVNQEQFDDLFSLLLHHERLLVMRAADAIEKITLRHREFIQPHKKQLLNLLKSALHKELKWHLALLVPRLKLEPNEFQETWQTLSYWARNPNESKIVRVNSLQGLFELSNIQPGLKDTFLQILAAVAHEPIPSLQARIRKLRGG